METAKLVSMTARPFRTAQLCFEVDGILDILNVQLGAQINSFDFTSLFTTLEGAPTVVGDPSRLQYNFRDIQGYVQPYALATLRSEGTKATLNKAINARQNAYYAKYANAPAIIAQMNASYAPAVKNSKPDRLAALVFLSQYQADILANAYEADSRGGVVKFTTSLLSSTTQSSGTTQSTGSTDSADASDAVSAQDLPTLPSGGGSLAGWGFSGDNPMQLTFQEGTSGSSTSSSGDALQNQSIYNIDYAYRVPSVESQAQYQRAQISLIDEQFQQFMAGQVLPNLAQIFENELASIDSDVCKLQVAFLNTILMSPMPGTITGIYKFPGDWVRAGEPVIRVENSSTVFLTGTLVYRGSIAIGTTVTVTTALFDQSGAQVTVSGVVLSARGLTADDHWEIVVQCGNSDSTGSPIFPVNYRLDADDTQISIG